MEYTNFSFHRLPIPLMLLGLATVAFSSFRIVRQLQRSIVPTSAFFRVDHLPSGDQIALPGVISGGTMLFVDKTIEHTYEAQYDKVWYAARRAEMRLDAENQKTIMSGVTVKYRAITALDKTMVKSKSAKFQSLAKWTNSQVLVLPTKAMYGETNLR